MPLIGSISTPCSALKCTKDGCIPNVLYCPRVQLLLLRFGLSLSLAISPTHINWKNIRCTETFRPQKSGRRHHSCEQRRQNRQGEDKAWRLVVVVTRFEAGGWHALLVPNGGPRAGIEAWGSCKVFRWFWDRCFHRTQATFTFFFFRMNS